MTELKQRITYSEFLEWLHFLNWEEGRPIKTDYYLAQIAAEVRRGLVKNPKSVKVNDFLIKLDKESRGRSSDSKGIWLAALGVKTK